MAESGKDVKAPNVFKRVKEEMEAVFQSDKHHHKETHGLNYGIDENTSTSDVKAPNVFERAKEEFEALAETIHPKKGLSSQHSALNDETRHCKADDDSKFQVVELRSANLAEKSNQVNKSLMHAEKSAHHHHKETHGRSDDIDENTPISQVKGPNVFERAKEEIEALIQTIHPKRDTGNVVSSPKKEGGLPISLGIGMEKLCSPRSHNKDE